MFKDFILKSINICLNFIYLSSSFFLNFISVVMIFIFCNISSHLLISIFDCTHFVKPNLFLNSQNVLGVWLRKRFEFKVSHLFCGCIFIILILLTNIFIFSFKDFYFMVSLLVRNFFCLYFMLHYLYLLFQKILFVVKFILKSQEMLIQWNSIS